MKDPAEIRVRLDGGSTVTALAYPAADVGLDAALLLAHGAGAGQRSPFMVGFAQALAALGVETITFDFPYIEGRRRLPDRRPVLEACYRVAVETVRREIDNARAGLFIGGKSMGGRIATCVAASDRELPVAGLVLLGYPLHPPGRPAQRRDARLRSVGRPMLFVQGSRDAFGTPAELELSLAASGSSSSIYVVEGGDHSFRLPRAGEVAQEEALRGVREAVVQWIRSVLTPKDAGGSTSPRPHGRR